MVKYYFWGCLWRCFCNAFGVISGGLSEDHHTDAHGTIQTLKGLSRTERERKEWLALCRSASPICPALGHQCPWVSGFSFRLVFVPLTPLLLRPFSLHWNYTTGFPGPPACKWQIARLSSLHSCVSQSLINLFLYISTHLIVILFLWGTLTSISSIILDHNSSYCSVLKAMQMVN